ncbi:MAG: acyltransferase 3 [Polaromonas sp.]|nr:acyltransferase 3 [Polaromonas sp.]
MSGPHSQAAQFRARQPGIDALKGLACALIVWHHLAFYGPMSDVVYPHFPGLTDWLYHYGRMAVQVFLVVGGFLAAGSLAPAGIAVSGRAGRLILRRYQRLLLPYLVALGVGVLVAALVRPWFEHSSVSGTPTAWQLLAHALLLQDVLDQEALSAGVWYVAIDFQLFVMSVLLFSLARRMQKAFADRSGWPAAIGIALVAVLAVLSLFVFNLEEELSMTGLYFFGAYALGMLAFWISRTARPGPWLLGLGIMGSLALLFDFRERLAVALAVAFGLVWLAHRHGRSRPGRRLDPGWLLALQALGTMSYSIFLIHFPVCLLVNALVNHFWPTQLLANGLGLFAAFGLSLLAGRALYLGVESRRTTWLGGCKASGVLH